MAVVLRTWHHYPEYHKTLQFQQRTIWDNIDKGITSIGTPVCTSLETTGRRISHWKPQVDVYQHLLTVKQPYFISSLFWQRLLQDHCNTSLTQTFPTRVWHRISDVCKWGLGSQDWTVAIQLCVGSNPAEVEEFSHLGQVWLHLFLL